MTEIIIISGLISFVVSFFCALIAIPLARLAIPYIMHAVAERAMRKLQRTENSDDI